MIGVIGGTGLDQLPGVQVQRRHNYTSKYGAASDSVLELEVEDQTLLFLARHGSDHSLAPHLINFRANIWALHKLGVTKIISVNACGGINQDFAVGDLVVPDQIIDYTHGRESTFFDGVAEPLHHCDFTEPFSQDLRLKLLEAATLSERTTHQTGVYGCTQGPRLETAAEIQKLRRDGCDLVGMTAMPEAALARELGIEFASICMTVNLAAGLAEEPLSMEEIIQESATMANDVREILLEVVVSLGAGQGAEDDTEDEKE